MELEPYGGEKVPAVELFRGFFDPEPSESTLRRYLSVPIAVRDRAHKEKQLGRLLGRDGSSVSGAAVSES